MSALYIGELKSILSHFNESWNEGFSRKHWSIVNGAYDCAYELHYYDDKYNDQFLLTCFMDRFDTPKRAQYEIGFNKAFNDSQINQILDTLNEYLGHNFTCCLRENNESFTVQPQTKEELVAIIKQTCEEQGWDCDLNFIDTSKITDMSFLFSNDDEFGYGLSDFNGDISQWNTSNVTNMSHMFLYTNFNKSLNKWDVSNVETMAGMFEYAYDFDQPLDKWNTKNVKNMAYMFNGAAAFNQPLNHWDTSSVTNMEGMFFNAVYNQPLDNWYISSHTNIYEMFGDDCCFKSQLPKFTGFEDSMEKLLEKLGLPPDYKPEIKKEQEQEKVHKKSRV